MSKDLRFPKQFGDFAETLSMYVLGLQNWSVALIDHVGADLIAVSRENTSIRLAISVKGRNFPDNESRSFSFDKNNIDKLKATAELLGMEPAISFVFVDKQEECQKIRVIMAKISDLEELALDSQIHFVNYNRENGLQIKFTHSQRIKHLENIKQTKKMYYSELSINELNSFDKLGL
ncbi:TPA: hypothetical protein ACGOSV_000199 [Streptococcus suis]